jgi:hypothetical protein
MQEIERDYGKKIRVDLMLIRVGLRQYIRAGLLQGIKQDKGRGVRTGL